jgi:hypothetical protein
VGKAAFIYCTIVTARRLPRALHLIDSVRKHNQSTEFRILLQEHPLVVARLRARVRNESILGPDEIDCGDWLHRAFICTEAEFAAALRPAFLNKVAPQGNLISVDPDSEAYSSPADFESEASEHDMTVVPRNFQPADLRGAEERAALLALGPFDHTLFAVRSTPSVVAALGWWRNFVSGEPPALQLPWLMHVVNDIRILRDSHFLTTPGNPEVARAAHPDVMDVPYSFGTYTDGMPIPERHRRVFANLAEPNRQRIPNPFAVGPQMHKLIADSEDEKPSRSYALEEKINRLERQLNALPYSLIGHTGALLGSVSPRAKDEVWRLLQAVSKAYGAARSTWGAR